MFDTEEYMRKSQRLCDLANAIVEERDYAFEMLMQEQNATMRDERIVAKYQGMVDVLNHLMNKHLL